MSKTNIPEKAKILLWAKAGGRCQYRGCNKDLTEDLASGTRDAKFGFLAHVVADEPGGPRGDAMRSANLAKDIGNLMLMCGTHHRLIDDEKPDEHPETLLLGMKSAHETRIREVTEVGEDRASHALCYDAIIGGNESPVAFDRVRRDMLPHRYPAEGRPIQIGMLGTTARDGDPDYWTSQRLLLRQEFAWKVRERIARREIGHLSVFALAPQPLLMELGRLLCDIVPAEVHQFHRNPKGWRWSNDAPPVVYEIGRPARISGPPALVLAVSATISDDRITSAMGEGATIWSIRATGPHNDIIRSTEDLAAFVRVLKLLLNEIKTAHGENSAISVFPAIPVSAAVEVGRSWMPKADLPLLIYDQQPGVGFKAAFSIRSGEIA